MNNELSQTLPSFDPTCYSDKENSVPYVSKSNFVDESSNIFNPPLQPPIYSCEFCGSNAQYGHYCTPQALFINLEPGYSQDFNFPQNIHDFQQQYFCYDKCGGPHETFQCQKKQEEKRIEEEQAANARYWKIPACCDDDDDYDSAITPVLSTEETENSLSMGDEHLDTILATESDEVIKSSVEDLVPIPSEFEGLLDGFLCRRCTCEWCGNNLRDGFCSFYNSRARNSFIYDSNPNSFDNPLDFSYHPPQPQYETYSCEFCGNDAHYGYDCPPQNCPAFYDDDEEFSIPMSEICKSSLTPITPDFSITDSLIMEDKHIDTIPEMESDEGNESSVEDLNITPSESEDLSDIKKSLLNQDTLIISSPFDSFLEEFSGELAHIDLIPPGTNEADFDPEEDIYLVERFLYDNSSPRPPKEFNSKNFDAIIESFSPSPIPIADSDSLMEEIDLFLTPDDSMPPGIKNDDYDSKGDILLHEEFLSNDSPSFPENDSFHFDVQLSPRPPAKLPNDGIYFEPDTGLLTAKMVGDISTHYVTIPRLLPTQPILCLVIDNLFPFSSENEDKVHLLPYWGFKASQLISHFSKSPMMIYGGNIPILEVPSLHFYPP
nr:pre-mRNA splicing Prp18-interacting factor [Tanacetum cinerariifolium]